MSMCGVCWFDGRALTDEIYDLRKRVEERDAEINTLQRKINWYESAVCCDIPHAIWPGVTGKAIDCVKVAELIRERDVLLDEVAKVKDHFD